MNRSERTYNQLFGLLRDTHPANSLAPEEVQSLLEKPLEPADDTRRFGAISPARRAGIVMGLLGASIVGVWLALAPSSSPDRVASSGPLLLATRSQQKQPAAQPESNAAAPSTTSAAGETKVTGNTIAAPGAQPRATTPRAARVSRTLSAPRVPAATAEETPTNDRSAQERTLAARKSSSSRPAETTAFPMLELSQDELKALGVAFIDGEIQTFGEEYYTIATDEDRALYASMGMDTSVRSGIVRMRVSIDTFGLTTKKYSWTRVESYSRIAPIIALNSYVRDEHSSAVVLNSFNRSPIVDSANRSIAFMVRALAKVLASDNVERMMHDADHANPAPMLVPVHIRLGDEPIGGSSKRRGADIILWYYPTPEFAAALPARYRISLQKELNAIADVVECNLPPGEACRQMTGEPLLLNYCRRTSGALSGLSVSPNPARGSVTMRYNVESDRTVTTALHGIRGERIRELIPSKGVGTGTHSVTLQLDGVAPGAYMVVLRTERGEEVSERLIVQ